MIKLVASDLDGTLLAPDGSLPEGIFQAIRKLHTKGIAFVPASGRQLAALEQMFGPVLDDILLLAENGAIVSHGRQLLYCEGIPREDVFTALRAAEKIPSTYPLLCTPECAYYERGDETFLSYVKASYVCNAQASLDRIAQSETVCKIAVFDALGPENNAMKKLPQALTHLRVIQSGGDWLDISAKTTDKGRAMRFIQKRLSLSPEECAAFGDHMNDYEMLLACGHSYVTENGYPPLRSAIGRTIPSNAENGVLQALHAIADGRLP